MQARITHCEVLFGNMLTSKDEDATVAPASYRKVGTASQPSHEGEPFGFAGCHGALIASGITHFHDDTSVKKQWGMHGSCTCISHNIGSEGEQQRQ